MSDDKQRVERSLADRLFGWARGGDASHAEGGRDEGPPVPTKVLGKLVTALAGRPAPSMLDLGPVVGSNVAFFGEALGCRLHLEDLYADVDRVAASGDDETLPAVLSARFETITETFDAVLCWDLFDHLDKASAKAVGQAVAERVRPGGLVMGVFQTQLDPAPVRTRYVIVDAGHLQHRTYPSTRGRRTVFQSRDVERLFPGLTVSDSILMLNRTREVLLRKCVSPADSRS